MCVYISLCYLPVCYNLFCSETTSFAIETHCYVVNFLKINVVKLFSCYLKHSQPDLPIIVIQAVSLLSSHFTWLSGFLMDDGCRKYTNILTFL